MSLHLGAELSARQWRAVLNLKQNVEFWNRAGTFGPAEMGRAASKFEGLEDLLQACKREWASVPEGLPLSEACLSFEVPSHALPVEPDRLNFPGQPSFDPSPFLDTANRRVYEDPLKHARPLEPVPRPISKSEGDVKEESRGVKILEQVVAGEVASVGMLEILAGGLVSALQLRRRLLCLLEEIYAAQQHRSRKSFVPVTGTLADELLACAVLLCQSDVDLRAEGAPLLLCTDASSTREASAVARISEACSVELTRHGLQRGLWCKLLSPLQALLRERGELDDEDGVEADQSYDSHPVWETLCRSQRFKVFGPVKSSDRRVHINVAEVRAAITGEERVGYFHPNCRYVHLQDSQVGMRELDIVEPFWLQEAFAGRFEGFDSFLEQCGMDLNRLAGLPDPAELLPDCPVDVRNSEVARKHRACRDPESFAAHLLELPSITAADALTLFRKLPKEAASRATKPRRDECSFAAGVFVHGGVLGLRRTCSQHPKSVQVFTRLIRESHPKLIFSSFTVNQNVGTLPHTDSHDADTAALDLLCSYPPGRFVFSSVFPSLHELFEASAQDPQVEVFLQLPGSAIGRVTFLMGARGFDLLMTFSATCVFSGRGGESPPGFEPTALAGQRLLCGCTQRHAMLRGRDCKTGVLWTKLAEAYPRRFCTLLANAIASDLSWSGDYRSLDITKCAKCSGARIGEAGNPGPRGARKPRPPLVLRDIKLVEPGTSRLRTRVWNLFREWLERGAGKESWTSVRRLPELLVQMLIIYGQSLYNSGSSLQVLKAERQDFLTPGLKGSDKLFHGRGLRGGGAVAAYRRGDQVSEIQWRMRLQHVGTLAFYLQEVVFGEVGELALHHVTVPFGVGVETGSYGPLGQLRDVHASDKAVHNERRAKVEKVSSLEPSGRLSSTLSVPRRMSWRVSILSSVLLLPAMSDGDDAGRMDFFCGSSVRIDPHQNSTPVAAVSRANASSAASVAQCGHCLHYDELIGLCCVVGSSPLTHAGHVHRIRFPPPAPPIHAHRARFLPQPSSRWRWNVIGQAEA
ncbi:unnamed protein product [Symbiodinium microadriaticum]|nr:unnamed protein product [Symbiodinium microadriaticum]